KQDGVATPALQQMIFGAQPAAAATPTPSSAETPAATAAPADEGGTLKYGSTGDAVKALQKRLKTLKYFAGTPLGNYKTQTVAAVKAYQKAMGLKQDGVATPALQQMIFTKIEAVSGTVYRRVALSSASATMNVRKGFTTDATVVCTAKHGARVRLLATAGDWSRIQADGKTGYVMTKYLAADAPSDSPESAVKSAVKADELFGYAPMEPGDAGGAVKAMQKRLKALKYFGGTPLGNYKSQTAKAVAAFQKAVGLTADGAASAETLWLLSASGAPKAGAALGKAYAKSAAKVYKRPDTGSGAATSVSLGAALKTAGAKSDWVRVKVGDKWGYMRKSDISGAKPK
ncbi:MAG: SH3 domain-containing protein, partial [Clostridiales bacterium]|nr:SH3 domain-containing protein [Clostridiales bacterium]